MHYWYAHTANIILWLLVEYYFSYQYSRIVIYVSLHTQYGKSEECIYETVYTIQKNQGNLLFW